jgi:5-methylcytosine-specific restriction endonuclease McrA
MSDDPRYSSGQWQSLRKLILERDRYVCQIRAPGCRHLATQCDHIVSPLEDGSFWDPVNLRASCLPCNVRAGHRVAARRQLLTGPDLPLRL